DPVHILGIDADDAPAKETQPTPMTVYLATPCDVCSHTLNWHRNDVGCTVSRCVCSRFRPAAPAKEA
ncbi:hypothetical protein, partial [Streptomyces sp. C1-2]|uniref:hypothetical protein n=1 Tax=Streptomyces sp. C1-2 TaxID=2720022 RepID=UPI001432496C